MSCITWHVIYLNFVSINKWKSYQSTCICLSAWMCMSLGVFYCFAFVWRCFWIPCHAKRLSWSIYSLKFCVIRFLFANMASGLPALRHHPQLWSWQTLAQTKLDKILEKKKWKMWLIGRFCYVVGLFVKWMQKVMNEQVFVFIVGSNQGWKERNTHTSGVGGNYNIHGGGCASSRGGEGVSCLLVAWKKIFYFWK